MYNDADPSLADSGIARNVDADLGAARTYLWALGTALMEAATSYDPRVVAFGLALARAQGTRL
jgi:hypothetical protein